MSNNSTITEGGRKTLCTQRCHAVQKVEKKKREKIEKYENITHVLKIKNDGF